MIQLRAQRLEVAGLLGEPKMTTDLEKIAEAMLMQDNCHMCGGNQFTITETRTTVAVIDPIVEKGENRITEKTPIYNYEIKCSRCKDVITRQTVVKQTWREYWNKIGAILDERRKWRTKATGRNKND